MENWVPYSTKEEKAREPKAKVAKGKDFKGSATIATKLGTPLQNANTEAKAKEEERKAGQKGMAKARAEPMAWHRERAGKSTLPPGVMMTMPPCGQDTRRA